MKDEYDLNKIELKNYYEELTDLFLYKRTLIEDFMINYDNYDNYADIEILDYLLLNKIASMKK